jgi:hypothetical protein
LHTHLSFRPPKWTRGGKIEERIKISERDEHKMKIRGEGRKKKKKN